jgi:MFS family permease
VVYYGPIWIAFIAITFCASRYAGWIGALLSPVIIAVIIVFLDVRWIWDQMRNHPEEGRDADFVFWFGVLCRILLFIFLLTPVSFCGFWRKRVAQNKKAPNQVPEPAAASGRGAS